MIRHKSKAECDKHHEEVISLASTMRQNRELRARIAELENEVQVKHAKLHEALKLRDTANDRITELSYRIAKAVLIAKFPPVDRAILYELEQGK